jgi:hypothetical protein
MIEAGLVATGMQGFWVRAVVGLVFLAAVVFHLTIEDSTRIRALRNLFFRRPAPMLREAPDGSRDRLEELQDQDQTRRYLPRVD